MKYPIKYLESLSGIRAHTIRIWEQRYGLLKPKRTGSNIRLYDDDDLRTLLNVATLIEAGYRISQVADMSGVQMVKVLHELNRQGDGVRSIPVNDLILAGLAFNGAAFNEIYRKCVRQLGFRRTIEEVLYAALKKVGVLWQTRELNPAQEHFISAIVMQKIHAAADALPETRKGKNKFLLFLPEDEHHEVGLLYFNYLLREAGKETIYLGADVPLQNVKDAVNETRPSHLVLFLTTSLPAREAGAYLKQLRQAVPACKTILCGHPGLAALKLAPAQQFVSSPDEARRALGL